MKMNGNIIAHRGMFDNEKIPENSMTAFKKAIDNNYPIELDVQLTNDNYLVVFHDENMIRMTGEDKIIQKENYDDIKAIKLLGTNERIPLFSEVLELNKDKVMINIEIKHTKKIKKTCDILFSELSGYNNFVVQSFSPVIVRYIKKHYKDVEVGLLVNNKYSKKILNLIFKSKFIIMYSKADFLSVSKKLLKTKKFSKLSKKYPTFIWTVKTEDDINKNPDLIYICNNLPFNNKD